MGGMKALSSTSYTLSDPVLPALPRGTAGMIAAPTAGLVAGGAATLPCFFFGRSG